MKCTLNYVKEDDNRYSGYLMELPSVISQGNSLDDLKINIKQALEVFLEFLKEEEENQPIITGWENARKVTIEL